MLLVCPGRSVAVTIVEPSNGLPDGGVPRAGTETMAPKIVPPSAAWAYVPMLSMWAGTVRTK